MVEEEFSPPIKRLRTCDVTSGNVSEAYTQCSDSAPSYEHISTTKDYLNREYQPSSYHYSGGKPVYCDKCLHNYKPRMDHQPRGRSKRLHRKNRETVPDSLLKTSAISLCLECNIYLCSNCCQDHLNHRGYFNKENEAANLENTLGNQIANVLKFEETDKKSELRKEQLVVIDRVQIKHKNDKFKDLVIKGMCVVNNGLNWVVADNFNKCIKNFETRNNAMVRRVQLSSRPCGVTEIPCDNKSRFIIAITVPLPEHQITIIEIDSVTGARIINALDVEHEYTELYFLCGHFVAFCEDSGADKNSIHILSLSGEIIHRIKLHDIPGVNFSESSAFRLCVHKQSDSVYVCSLEDNTVIHMNINGIVINMFEDPNIQPSAICVDSHQNIYIASGSRPEPVCIYRLSRDFRTCDIFLGDHEFNFDDVQAMTWYNDVFYVSHEVRTALENTVSIIRHE